MRIDRIPNLAQPEVTSGVPLPICPSLTTSKRALHASNTDNFRTEEGHL